MIDLNILNEPHLVRNYLVANTPGYLYRNYRSDASVLEMASRNTIEDLISLAVKTENATQRTLREVVFAYAAIVALTFKNHSEVLKKTKDVSFVNLEWANKLLELGNRDQMANLDIVIKVPPKLEPKPTQPGSSTGTLAIEVH